MAVASDDTYEDAQLLVYPGTTFVMDFPEVLITIGSIRDITNNGFTFDYTVVHANSNGDFYYGVAPTGTLVTVEEVLNGDVACSGSEDQVDASQRTKEVECALIGGTTYEVYIVIDLDGNGGDAMFGIHSASQTSFTVVTEYSFETIDPGYPGLNLS